MSLLEEIKNLEKDKTITIATLTTVTAFGDGTFIIQSPTIKLVNVKANDIAGILEELRIAENDIATILNDWHVKILKRSKSSIRKPK